MTRVLVTGASGFIGRFAVPELIARGFEVHALGRTPPPDAPADVLYHACDLLDADAVADAVRTARATHLLHLAWYAKPGLFWTSLENLRWVAASLSLYLAFAEAGGRRAVCAGSCAEYDWRHADLREDDTPLVPQTLYGVAKRSLHQLLDAAGAQTGVQLAWGRIFFVYGPHEARGRLVGDIIASVLAGREAACTEGRQERDYMHVADVARAFVEVLASDVTGAVNIASGACVPIREVVSTIGTLAGAPNLVRLGALPSRAGDPPRLAASIERLRDTVGFRSTYDLPAGLADTIEWWRQHPDWRARS